MAPLREYWPESRPAVSGSQSRLHDLEELISSYLTIIAGDSFSMPPTSSGSNLDGSAVTSYPMQRWLHEKPSEGAWPAARLLAFYRARFEGNNSATSRKQP